MGIHQRKDTICDCCVEPMKDVLRQIAAVEGQTVVVETAAGALGASISTNPFVEEFLVRLDLGGGSFQFYPICQIVFVSPIIIPEIILEPIELSTGECRCCEDPITQFFAGQIGNSFIIDTSARQLQGQIVDVGEGIIRLLDSLNDTHFISACQIIEFQNIQP
jgi:hypothetical protein